MTLDDRVLALISSEPQTLNGIYSKLRDARTMGKTAAEDDRQVDRALQRLRKAGKIKYEARAWRPIDEKQCPTCGGRGRV